MTTAHKLFLFDIDGTLLTSGGAGERALRLGFRDRFGIDDDLSSIEIAGRTDSGIVREMLAAHRLPATPENIAAFLDGYLHHLAQEIPRTPGRLLPGILPLLDAAITRATAAGDAHHDRNQLGPFAQARARAQRGIEFPPERIFVLGDTPHDIACARAIGAKAIAIATGKFSQADLAAQTPDFLFEDLGDLDAVLAAIA